MIQGWKTRSVTAKRLNRTLILWRIKGRRAARAFGPVMARPRLKETLRAALGAGLALVLCGSLLIGADLLFGPEGLTGLFLIAPLGATAFLIFAIPNSPLAQPWSAIMGNTVSALVAVTVLQTGWPVTLVAGLSVCGAIVAMALLRAMHPPGAAVALATALGGASLAPLGYSFAFMPVMLDSAILVLAGIAYNSLTGRKYPFRQRVAVNAHQTADPVARRRLGLSNDDLADLLGRFNLSANIGAEDFGRILAAAEEEAARRRFNGLRCGDFMSRDVVTVTAQTRLGVVADLFRKHHFKTLPVVDEKGLFLGIISQNNLIQKAREEALDHHQSFATAMSRLRHAGRRKPLRAGDIMTVGAAHVTTRTSVGDLIPILADGGVQAAPVLENGRLIGVITRSDLLEVLARADQNRPFTPG